MSNTAISIPESLREGRYVLGKLLGQGGMAVVVVAHDTALGVDRAVKILSPHGGHRESLRRRLKAEARAMARLNHPNILAIHDVGVEGDLDYVVMDLATGGSLNDLQAHGPLDPWVATSFMVQVLSALAAAHAQGIVHRDIKPHNVLLDHNGRALLADFGIALLAGEDRRTRTGVAMGSIAYMPPEQRLDAARVGPQADLYACGSTLYNLITGSNPVDLFLAGEQSQRWKAVPEELRPMLRKATQMDPEDRYQDAACFAHALMYLLNSCGVDLPSLQGITTSLMSSDRDTIGAGGRSIGAHQTHEPTAAAMDYIDNRVPTVTAVELPEITVDPIEPVLAPLPLTDPPNQTTGETTLADRSDASGSINWVMGLPFLLLLLGGGVVAWTLLRPMSPSSPTEPPRPITSSPAAPVPSPVIAPTKISRPPPEAAPLPAALPPPPEPAPPRRAPPRRAPRPTAGITGEWTGSLGGIYVTFSLSGSNSSLRGTVTSTFGTKSSTSEIVGTFDPTTYTLHLHDRGDEGTRTRYTLSKEGNRMTGEVHTPRGKKRLILKRTP